LHFRQYFTLKKEFKNIILIQTCVFYIIFIQPFAYLHLICKKKLYYFKQLTG
jgi:hypothetical protein